MTSELNIYCDESRYTADSAGHDLAKYEAMAEAAPKHLQKIPGNATLARPGIGQRRPEGLSGAAAT